MSRQATTLDEVYRMRVTSEQKQKLSLVSASADYRSMSDFWRNFNVSVADMLLKVSTGGMTPEEFGSKMEDFARDYLERYGGEP